MKLKVHLSAVLICLFSLAKANNIQVANVSLNNWNNAQNYVDVEFDISWNNSWKTNFGPANHDAAWVFIKYRKNTGPWQHAWLSPMGFTAPNGSTIELDSVNPKGAMIYRTTNGSGISLFQNVRLRWNYTADTSSIVSNTDVIDIKVFAIEMVYVPQGNFYAGDGRVPTSWNNFKDGSSNNPYHITSENPINISSATGDLYYDANTTFDGDQTGTLDAEFPKGYDGFYCMKYEVSEKQYVEFFNTLTIAQKISRNITDSTSKNLNGIKDRNTVTWAGGSNNAVTTAPNRAMSYIRWPDMAAYLWWSGLRPMTELEYEKACRGPITPVPKEFAWGTTNYNSNAYAISNDGTANATITNMSTTAGNIGIYNSVNPRGPLRCGIFASSSINNTREETGATYYGIMEMSGNLEELCITVGGPEGRDFEGIEGNGKLDANGDHPITLNYWPSNLFISQSGLAKRGGGFQTIGNFYTYELSNRSFGSILLVSISEVNQGIRGVKSDF